MGAESGAREGRLEFGEERLRELIVRHAGKSALPSELRILGDTTNFIQVDYGDVLVAGGRPYLIRNNEREGRFGLDDEPKFWVKRSVDLLTGETKVIKLGFREKFQARVGDLVFDCVRSPKKEARILALVRGDHRFMQGVSVEDEAGNTVRIIDFIRGRSLADVVFDNPLSHEEYFFTVFPGLLVLFVDLIEAIRFLHVRGERHGDIRRDHILVEKDCGEAKWIDFDFNYYHAPNPGLYDLFGLGNILAFLVGKGDLTPRELREIGGGVADGIGDEDMNVVFRNRVVNVRKVYPYVPEELNRILLHFAAGAKDCYESVDEILEDLGEVRQIHGDGAN